VGRIGDEALLGAEGGLEPGEEAVDGVGEILQLVARPREGEALVQVALRDLARRRRHRPQRSQDPARDQPAEGDRDHGHDRERDPGPDEQLVEIFGVDVFEFGEFRFDDMAKMGGEVDRFVGRDDQVDPGGAAEEEVGDREERRPRDEEQAAVEEGQAQADSGGGKPGHGQIR
jgi:hypothetical protein